MLSSVTGQCQLEKSVSPTRKSTPTPSPRAGCLYMLRHMNVVADSMTLMRIMRLSSLALSTALLVMAGSALAASPPITVVSAENFYGDLTKQAVGPRASPVTAQAQAATPVSATLPAADDADPCDGLLATLDRPTVADSPCVVKSGHAIAELGYQTGPVKGSDINRLSFYPQAELRFGLPENWELKLFPPNYNMTTQRAFVGGGHIDGFGDTSFGIKHQFGSFGGFLVSADVKLTIPTGQIAFSSGGTQANIQGIVSYDLTPALGISGLLGISTLTNRTNNGGVARFTSVNPDVVITYLMNEKLQLYGEIYGNTKTAADQGLNYSIQGGAQYLITKNVEVDASGGVLLHGPAGVQSRFVNFGVGLLF